MTSYPWQRTLGGAIAFVAVLALFAGQPANADPLDKFTGYTRMGDPPSSPDEKDKEPIAPLAKDGKIKVRGLTIYFMVLDRKKGDNRLEGDTWGIGQKGFDST